MAFEYVPGVHLHRTDENVDEIDRLRVMLGEPSGVDAVLDDLNRRGRVSPVVPARAVDRAYTWDGRDRRDPVWWPQGISTSADASDTDEIAGRRVLAISWYAKERKGVRMGSRISFFDLDTQRYRHVLLVVPALDERGRLRLAPLKVHAGGIVWFGPYLHIAATARGIITCRLDDIMRIPDRLRSHDRRRLSVGTDELASFGYRYVLPVRFSYRASTDRGHTRLRYSFMSLDQTETPYSLVTGEYGRGEQTTRLARFPIDHETSLPQSAEDGYVRPVRIDDGGVPQMQGVAVVKGRYYATVSHGPYAPGGVCSGRPGRLHEHKMAAPIGPEDLSYWPSTDTFWSVTEHPRRRWIYSMKRSWFSV